MAEDYDIYSYLAVGLAKGDLTLMRVREKVFYEIVDIDLINLNGTKSDVRYKLYVLGENYRKFVNEDGSPIVFYENIESLNNDYIKVTNRKYLFKKKKNILMVLQLPKTIKVPIDKNTKKLSIIDAGKWIDITDVDNLKIYSEQKFNQMFEFIDEDAKIIRRASTK